jgi:hypothetical protein
MVGAYLYMCVKWYCICAVGLGFVCVVCGGTDGTLLSLNALTV